MKSIDILIPTYNRAEFLGQTLTSLINQTYKNIRVIIYDDGSTDNTPDIIADFMKKNITILYIRSIHNNGVAYARNVLLDNISADYAMWQDSDDIAFPNRVKYMLSNIEETKADICFSDLTFFTGKANPLKPRNIHKIDISKYIDRDGLYRNMNFATAIFKPELSKYRFNEDLRRKEDVEWIMLLIKNNIKFGYLSTPLYACRRHPGRLTK